MQTKVYCIFSVVFPKRNDWQTFKPSNVAVATNVFSSVYVLGVLYHSIYRIKGALEKQKNACTKKTGFFIAQER